MIPAVGTVPTTSAALVTIPRGTLYRVTKMGFSNNNVASRTLTVSLKIRGVTRQVFPTITLATNQVLEEYSEFNLEGDDAVVGVASGSDVVFHFLGYRL
jgi:hypothetical protein